MQNIDLAIRLDGEILASALFKEAITHRSAGATNNERLEYLGDAVLGMIIAEHLFRAFAGAKEGDLSRLRAHLVRKDTLASIARELCLGKAIVLGPGEIKSGGHRRDTILADALEAVIAAVYLTKGMEYTKAFVLELFQPRIGALPPPYELKDSKTRLQEYLQSRSLPLPEYRLLRTSGESHAQHFTVRCRIERFNIEALGDGSSKREAEQAAAQKVLDIIYPDGAG